MSMLAGARATPMMYAPFETRPIDGVDSVTPAALLDPNRPRAVMALSSGDDTEIDWALGRLLQASYHAPPPGIQLSLAPHLLGLVVDFPARLAHALAGHAPAFWADAPQGSDNADNSEWASESGSDGEHWADCERFNGQANDTGSTAFSPASSEAHHAFLRRALQATVFLRNVSLEPSPAPGLDTNSRLLKRSGIINAVVLSLTTLLQEQGLLPAPVPPLRPPLDSEAGAGLNELVLNLLDLIESFADDLNATASVGFELQKLLRTLAFGPDPTPVGPQGTSNSVEGTADRTMLLCALRVLAKMVSQPNNAAAFHEDIPTSSGGKYPTSWPLTWLALKWALGALDNDLLESSLELLHGLVIVAGNGLCLAAYPGMQSSETIPPLPASPAAAAVPALLRSLTVHRTEWDREAPLAPHATPASIQSKVQQRRDWQRTREDAWKRAAHQAAAAITPSNVVNVPEAEAQPLAMLTTNPAAAGEMGSALYRAMRLTMSEASASSSFAALAELQRAQEWVSATFEPDPVTAAVPAGQAAAWWEVPQAAFCAAYQDTVAVAGAAPDGRTLALPPETLLNLPKTLFRVPGPVEAGDKFIVRGIRVRVDRVVRAVRQMAEDTDVTPQLRKLCQDWLKTYLPRRAGAPAWARAGASDPAFRPAGACPWSTSLDPGADLSKEQIEEELKRQVAEAGRILCQDRTSSREEGSEVDDRYNDARHCQWTGCTAAAPETAHGEDAYHWLKSHVRTHLPPGTTLAPLSTSSEAGIPPGAAWRDVSDLRAAQTLLPFWVSPLDPVPPLAYRLTATPVAKRVVDSGGQDEGGTKRLRVLRDTNGDTDIARYAALHDDSTTVSAITDTNDAEGEANRYTPWYLERGAMSTVRPLRTTKVPGTVKFVVARTPLHPNTSIPSGCAAMAALILRSATVQVADALGAEADEQEEEQALAVKQREKRMRVATKDDLQMVGFPFAPAAAPAPARSASPAPGHAGESARACVGASTGTGAGTGEAAGGDAAGSGADVARAVARAWLNTLVDAEAYLVLQSASNDILSGILQDTLACLPRPRTGARARML